jgi:hypothetical protein
MFGSQVYTPKILYNIYCKALAWGLGSGLAWAFRIWSQAKNFVLSRALAWPGLAFWGLAWPGFGLEARPGTSLPAEQNVYQQTNKPPIKTDSTCRCGAHEDTILVLFWYDSYVSLLYSLRCYRVLDPSFVTVLLIYSAFYPSYDQVITWLECSGSIHH